MFKNVTDLSSKWKPYQVTITCFSTERDRWSHIHTHEFFSHSINFFFSWGAAQLCSEQPRAKSLSALWCKTATWNCSTELSPAVGCTCSPQHRNSPPPHCPFTSPIFLSPSLHISISPLLSLSSSNRHQQPNPDQNRFFSMLIQIQVSQARLSSVSCWGCAAGCLQHFMRNIFHYIFHFQLSTFLSYDFRLKQQEFCTAYLLQYDLSVSC